MKKNLLSGFSMIRPAGEGPFLTLSKYGITFSKQSIECLDYPAYVHAFINREKKQVAVRPAGKDRDAMPFMKDDAAKRRSFVRWSNRALLREMLELMGESLGTSALRVNGVYYPEEQTVIYDLMDYQPVTGAGKT